MNLLQSIYQKLIKASPKYSNIRNNFCNNSYADFTIEEKNYINNIEIEFIFAEFGGDRQNAGDARFDNTSRLDPTMSSLKRFFPKALFTVYSDFNLKADGATVIAVTSPVKNEDNNPRFGHRSSVYYRFMGLLESSADFRCAIDTDMFAASKDILALVTLTEKFGFCVPYNARQLLRQDTKLSLDTKEINDPSLAMGRAYNQSPMTLWKNSCDGILYYQKCAEIMQKSPARGSNVMWRAAWETGKYPYVLPSQFCVCGEDVGCGDEVLLHVGHQSVADYYNIRL